MTDFEESDSKWQRLVEAADDVSNNALTNKQMIEQSRDKKMITPATSFSQVKVDPARQQELSDIFNQATKSEKMAWDRKMDNMVKLIAKIRPIENEIVALIATKQPILDSISELRREMVRDCVHPVSMLTDVGDGTARCSFCDKRLAVHAKVEPEV